MRLALLHILHLLRDAALVDRFDATAGENHVQRGALILLGLPAEAAKEQHRVVQDLVGRQMRDRDVVGRHRMDFFHAGDVISHRYFYYKIILQSRTPCSLCSFPRLTQLLYRTSRFDIYSIEK